MSLNSFVQLCLFSQNKCLGSEWSFKTICLKLSAETLPHCALGPHSLEEQSGGPHTHTLGHVWSPVTVCHWTTGHCSSALPMTAKYVMRPIKANWFCNTEPSQDSWMFLNILQFSLSGPRDWRKSVLAAFTNPEETGMEDRIMCSSGVFLALSGQFYKKKKKKMTAPITRGTDGPAGNQERPHVSCLGSKQATWGRVSMSGSVFPALHLREPLVWLWKSGVWTQGKVFLSGSRRAHFWQEEVHFMYQLSWNTFERMGYSQFASSLMTSPDVKDESLPPKTPTFTKTVANLAGHKYPP